MSRQIERTRSAITSAFAEMALSGRYEQIKMVDIARRANVGRSTIYQHYPDKDAVLLDAMAWVLTGLASCAKPACQTHELLSVVSHIWQNRDKGRRILTGVTGQKLEQALSQRIVQDLSPQTGAADWRIAPVFCAHQISAVVFSLLRNWLAGEASATAADMAEQMRLSAVALRRAALWDRG